MSGDPSSHSSIDVGNNSNAWTFHEPDPRGAEAGQFSLADFTFYYWPIFTFSGFIIVRAFETCSGVTCHNWDRS